MPIIQQNLRVSKTVQEEHAVKETTIMFAIMKIILLPETFLPHLLTRLCEAVNVLFKREKVRGARS